MTDANVILSGGFFNRLNGLVNGRLAFGDHFSARWHINRHLPHSALELFESLDGVEVDETDEPCTSPFNSDPEAGSLFYWNVSRHIEADKSQVAEAFRFFLSRLKVKGRATPSPIGAQYRGRQMLSYSNPDIFARRVIVRMKLQGETRCYMLADCHRSNLQMAFAGKGLEIVWGEAPPMATDMDRRDLGDQLKFIEDVLTLLNCDTILTSFGGSTITDSARAFGREVLPSSQFNHDPNCRFRR